MQSGFRPGDSIVYQLTSCIITFLKQWMSGLRQYFVISAKPLIEFGRKVYYINCKQMEYLEKLFTGLKVTWKIASKKTVINVCTSDNKSVSTGVRHGSVLGHLLFLVYISLHYIMLKIMKCQHQALSISM